MVLRSVDTEAHVSPRAVYVRSLITVLIDCGVHIGLGMRVERWELHGPRNS